MRNNDDINIICEDNDYPENEFGKFYCMNCYDSQDLDVDFCIHCGVKGKMESLFIEEEIQK
jgi:hypothetical protein